MERENSDYMCFWISITPFCLLHFSILELFNKKKISRATKASLWLPIFLLKFHRKIKSRQGSFSCAFFTPLPSNFQEIARNSACFIYKAIMKIKYSDNWRLTITMILTLTEGKGVKKPTWLHHPFRGHPFALIKDNGSPNISIWYVIKQIFHYIIIVYIKCSNGNERTIKRRENVSMEKNENKQNTLEKMVLLKSSLVEAFTIAGIGWKIKGQVYFENLIWISLRKVSNFKCVKSSKKFIITLHSFKNDLLAMLLLKCSIELIMQLHVEDCLHLRHSWSIQYRNMKKTRHLPTWHQ